MKLNRSYKDGIFRMLFNDEEKIRELYSALSGRACTDETLIEIKTVENVLYGNLKNDLAFMVDNQLVIIVEHQASINNNMPLRMLCYLSEVYREIVGQEWYWETLFKIPAPELYVLYNGRKPLPKELTLKLSDAFFIVPQSDCSVEVKVKVINVNYDANSELLTKSASVNEYAHLIHEIRQNQDMGYNKDSAVKLAIDYCKKHKIMLNFLKEHDWEVYNMLTTELTMEELAELRAHGMAIEMANDIAKDMANDMAKDMAKDIAKDMADNIAKDMAKDIAKNMADNIAKDMAKDIAKDMADDIAKDMAAKLKKENMTDEKIAEITGLSIKDVALL